MLSSFIADRRQARAFTLVEILIVVVVLGILAAIVVPQFASATNDAIKSHLSRNLQAVDHQVALYKANNGDRLPTDDPTSPMGAAGAAAFGWGVLVSENYLKEAPMNFYTSSAALIAGDRAASLDATSDAANGWFFEADGTSLFVYAAGYDPSDDSLAHERAGG